MNNTSRYLAFFAYLLSIVGALYVLLARRDDAFAVFHAKQSLAIAIAALVTPLVWVVVAWGGAWIPVVGPLIGLLLFALLIAIYIGLAVSWIIGMALALQGKVELVPFVGERAVGRAKTGPAPASLPEPEASSELVERTTGDV